MSDDSHATTVTKGEKRARAILEAGSLETALQRKQLEQYQDITAGEALVLGLLNQGVRTFIGVFGHGSTALAEVLRVYAHAGLLRVHNVRSEVEASHIASLLRWQYRERSAVITSIGPGALQAFAGSLVAASNSLGVSYIFGDETTHDEGPNMQQVPRREQYLYHRITGAMGPTYLINPAESIFTALKRNYRTTHDPSGEGPFFFLFPMNVQAQVIENCNLAEIPVARPLPRVAPVDDEALREAAALINDAERITVKTGGGARDVEPAVMKSFIERCGAAYVNGPQVPGIVPFSHDQHMGVGGSKGSLCGNHAMQACELLIVIGSRGVCQWDSSGTAWKSVKRIININTDADDSLQYNRTLPLVGDAQAIIERLNRMLGMVTSEGKRRWLATCLEKKLEWEQLCRARTEHPLLFDPVFGREVLTQPAAIATVIEFADRKEAVKLFDAGDVQANGFQSLVDERPGMTYNDSGSSYMGFASCALVASAIAREGRYSIAFTGDGSFLMNPQVLLDGPLYGLRGMIVLFDNRRMGAISGLQRAQYGIDFATDDAVAVDYVRMASAFPGVHALEGGCSIQELQEALEAAYRHPGLSVVHVPVYFGDDELGGLGVYGAWNVGNWCTAVQREKHRIGL